MLVFGPKNIEGPLSILVSDAILHFRTNHHLDTVHEVIHHIVETWLQGLQVDDVEVHFLLGGYLDSYVTFDVEQEATDGQGVVLNPLLLAFFVLFYFEKDDIAGGSGDQCLVFEEVHGTEVEICHFFQGVTVGLRGDCLALSVDAVHFICFVIKKAFVRKVLFRCSHWNFHHFVNDISLLKIIIKVVMCAIKVVKQVDKKRLIINKAAGDEGVWKVTHAHCHVVDADQLV
jgi:hypothetical protein